MQTSLPCVCDCAQVEEAQIAFRESLEITEALLGADHPVVANRLNNLASVLAEQGQAVEAEVCFVYVELSVSEVLD